MRATIEHVGADVLCRSEHTAPAECRLDGNTAQATLEAWASQYDDAVRTHNDERTSLRIKNPNIVYTT